VVWTCITTVPWVTVFSQNTSALNMRMPVRNLCDQFASVRGLVAVLVGLCRLSPCLTQKVKTPPSMLNRSPTGRS
jgi:hypothetical protein